MPLVSVALTSVWSWNLQKGIHVFMQMSVRVWVSLPLATFLQFTAWKRRRLSDIIMLQRRLLPYGPACKLPVTPLLHPATQQVPRLCYNLALNTLYLIMEKSYENNGIQQVILKTIDHTWLLFLTLSRQVSTIKNSKFLYRYLLLFYFKKKLSYSRLNCI